LGSPIHLAINLANRPKRWKFINFYHLDQTKDLIPAEISAEPAHKNGAFCSFCALLRGVGESSTLESGDEK
jgi:hypothetical protein